MNTTLDTVTIEIESQAKSAQSNLQELSTHLETLRGSVKGGFNSIKKLSESLSSLSSTSQDVPATVNNLKRLGEVTTSLDALSKVKSPTGVANAAKRIKELGDVSESLATTAGRLQNIEDIVTPLSKLATIPSPTGLSGITRNLTSLGEIAPKVNNIIKNMTKIEDIVEPLSKLSTIPSAKGLKQVSENLGKLPDAFAKLDAVPETMENIKRVSAELTDALTPLAEKLKQISDGYNAISALSNKYGVSVTKIANSTKKSTSALSVLKNALGFVKKGFNAFKTVKAASIDKLSDSFKKLSLKVKMVGLALLGTRSLFTMLRKGVSEYMNFDTELQKSVTNVWRAFGAQLAPVIEYVIGLFKQFVRVIYSIVKALTGIDLIARANSRGMDSYAKSLKSVNKELGSLQKFDDLNVVEFPKDKGAGADGFEPITLDEIDITPIQKVIDWVKKLKEAIEDAWDTGKWYGVGEVLAEGVNAVTNLFLTNIDTIRKHVFSFIDNVTDLLNGMIENINWGDVAKSLSEAYKLLHDSISRFITGINWKAVGEGLEDFIQNLDIAGMIKAKGNVWISILDGLKEVLDNIDFNVVGQKLNDFLVTLPKTIADIIDAIPWKELGQAIHDTISQLDWKTIFTNIVNIFKEILKGLNEFVQGLFNFDENTAKTFLEIAGGLVILLELFKALHKFKKDSPSKQVKETADSFKAMFDGFGKAAQVIAILGGLALVINSITGLLKEFSHSGLSLKDTGILLAEVLGLVAGTFITVALAVKSLNTEDIVVIGVIFAGLTATMLSLNSLLKTLNSLGSKSSTVFDGLASILVGLEILLWSLVGGALILGSDPLALIAIVALTASISAILITMAATLPIILDALGKFIKTIAPDVIKLVRTIGDIIIEIIYALGTILPPIIDTVGKLFNSVFKGVESIIKTVGKTIENIMKTAKSCIVDVLNAILRFINELGPAVNKLVDNIIKAVTKLINFVVSGMEYLINTAIVKPINALLNTIKKNKIIELLGASGKITTLSRVSIDRFAPKLATGTNEIPQEGLYHLHPGEAVVPKKYNPAIGGSDNRETNERLDTLIDVMRNLNFTNVVNLGNEQLYKKQQSFNKRQENKYGTLSIY